MAKVFLEQIIRLQREDKWYYLLKTGDGITINAPDNIKSSLDVLLIGGLPLEETVARYGPFVMNTKAEIYQAIDDYQNGRMGAIE